MPFQPRDDAITTPARATDAVQADGMRGQFVWMDPVNDLVTVHQTDGRNVDMRQKGHLMWLVQTAAWLRGPCRATRFARIDMGDRAGRDPEWVPHAAGWCGMWLEHFEVAWTHLAYAVRELVLPSWKVDLPALLGQRER